MAKEIIYTKHALEMLNFRRISKSNLRNCVNNPDKTLLGGEDRKVHYKKIGKKALKVVVSENEKVFVITCHWIASSRIKL